MKPNLNKEKIQSTWVLLLLLTPAACTTTTSYHWKEVPGPVRAQPAPQQVIAAPPIAFDATRDFADFAGDRVYFDTDSAVLRPDAKDILDRQAAWLLRHPDIPAFLEGNTDERASTEYNYQLGIRRAEAVRRYLIDKGIASSRLTFVSYGKTQPIAYGVTSEARARNRNVRVIVGR
jgi:peptidoglycan-associated lipoprotein